MVLTKKVMNAPKVSFIKYKISNNGIFLIKFFFQDQECENDESEEDSEEEGDESHEVGLSYLNKEGM